MSLSLPRTAELVGSHLWVEVALFGLTGAWSASGDHDATRGFMATQSALHAWRAEQWRSRLPTSVPAPDQPPSPGWREAVDRAASLEQDAERLVAWSRVLMPSLLVSYRRHLRSTSTAADAGLERWLSMALADASSGWLEGMDLLGGLEESGDRGDPTLATPSSLARVESELRAGLLRV